MNELLLWDVKFFYHINSDWRAAFLDALMPVCSYTPLLWAILAVALAYLVLASRRRADRRACLRRVLIGSIVVGICVGATDLTAAAIKKAAGRPRPHQSLALARYMDDRAGWSQNPAAFTPEKTRGSSFLSGHAANSMAVAAATAVLCPPAAPYVYALPLVVGYSRVYLGKHYPSDILAGWLAGWCLAAAISRLARRRLRL